MEKTVEKIGECSFIDEHGNLCLAESFANSEGLTTTSITIISELQEDN